jgi:predicted RNA-binding Zn ribbon-like protein
MVRGVETSAPLLGEPLPVELMNTMWADRDGVHDALADPDEAVAWLSAIASHVDPAVGDELARVGSRDSAHLARALRGLRDALRCLAADATHDNRTAGASPITDIRAAVADLNQTAAAAPLWSALELRTGAPPTRVFRSTGSAPEAAISQIANAAVALFAGPDRDLLRACHAPGCVLYFVKQHPRREWCSAGCGNRARVARHYQRHAATGLTASSGSFGPQVPPG